MAADRHGQALPASYDGLSVPHGRFGHHGRCDVPVPSAVALTATAEHTGGDGVRLLRGPKHAFSGELSFLVVLVSSFLSEPVLTFTVCALSVCFGLLSS